VSPPVDGVTICALEAAYGSCKEQGLGEQALRTSRRAQPTGATECALPLAGTAPGSPGAASGMLRV
jgi:hypothetical protein